jgi:hypothetical protein
VACKKGETYQPFKYLGSIFNQNNIIGEEINERLTTGKKKSSTQTKT